MRRRLYVVASVRQKLLSRLLVGLSLPAFSAVYPWGYSYQLWSVNGIGPDGWLLKGQEHAIK